MVDEGLQSSNSDTWVLWRIRTERRVKQTGRRERRKMERGAGREKEQRREKVEVEETETEGDRGKERRRDSKT